MTKSQNTSTNAHPQAKTVLLKMLSLSLPEDTQTWTRFDKRAKTYRTTSSSGPLWENVIERITIDDKTGHIMSLRERIAIIVHHSCGSNSILSFLDSGTAGLFNRSLVEISQQDRQYSLEISWQDQSAQPGDTAAGTRMDMCARTETNTNSVLFHTRHAKHSSPDTLGLEPRCVHPAGLRQDSVHSS